MSTLKRALLWVMGAFYVVAGLNHFLNPAPYLRMMPPGLPQPEFLVAASGVAESALGLAVLIPQTRRAGAWGLVLLLIGIFPANVYVALENVSLFGDTPGAGVWNWVRLPLQAVLIVWAWWYTRPEAVPTPAGGPHPVNR